MTIGVCVCVCECVCVCMHTPRARAHTHTRVCTQSLRRQLIKLKEKQLKQSREKNGNLGMCVDAIRPVSFTSCPWCYEAFVISCLCYNWSEF